MSQPSAAIYIILPDRSVNLITIGHYCRNIRAHGGSQPSGLRPTRSQPPPAALRNTSAEVMHAAGAIAEYLPFNASGKLLIVWMGRPYRPSSAVIGEWKK
jgi:hypothetical protein